MISALDISTSALVAQRTRLNAISSNIANLSTVRNENGDLEPYRARYVVLQSDAELTTSGNGVGVKVASVGEEQVDPMYRYQPNSPLAITSGKWKGYVAYPRVDLNTEFVDALQAVRAYEANVGVMEMTKGLGAQTLKILA
ncbi:MAG TPA: flagellar basal body rod protein FlgC [Planctomycetaceae bacterium]|nr:flagellar basal body rod protein FlgC [Planctomycetaceae bacterium]HRE98919.1 flagellar basal body rod protein FlgC [Pirellulaceae bacterium]